MSNDTNATREPDGIDSIGAALGAYVAIMKQEVGGSGWTVQEFANCWSRANPPDPDLRGPERVVAELRYLNRLLAPYSFPGPAADNPRMHELWCAVNGHLWRAKALWFGGDAHCGMDRRDGDRYPYPYEPHCDYRGRRRGGRGETETKFLWHEHREGPPPGHTGRRVRGRLP